MAKFQHPPIDSSKREIRVLQPLSEQHLALDGQIGRPKPANNVIVFPDLTLRFAIKVVSLDDKSPYTALSYVWGSDEAVRPITLNGHTRLITDNSYSALRHMQYADVAPAIWIDAICIDQAYDVEKTEQIKLMRSIYVGATCVIVWLGLPTEDSAFISAVLDNFAKNIQRRFNVPTPLDDELVEYLDFDSGSDVLDFLQSAIDPATSEGSEKVTSSKFVEIFFTFVTTVRWWYRTWVLQEFAFARNV